MYRTLRLYISHILEGAETREQTWTLRIEGRVVEAVCNMLYVDSLVPNVSMIATRSNKATFFKLH